MKKTFLDEVAELKAVADLLMPMSFPVKDFRDEQQILILKQRCFLVDGFDAIICYSKADHEEYVLESIQIQPSFTPFLPFYVVCKLGRAFLGSQNLGFIDFFRNNRKIYCWTVKTKNSRALPPEAKSKADSYDGFVFYHLPPGAVDLF